jgi:hypothetical protein
MLPSMHKHPRVRQGPKIYDNTRMRARKSRHAQHTRMRMHSHKQVPMRTSRKQAYAIASAHAHPKEGTRRTLTRTCSPLSTNTHTFAKETRYATAHACAHPTAGKSSTYACTCLLLSAYTHARLRRNTRMQQQLHACTQKQARAANLHVHAFS